MTLYNFRLYYIYNPSLLDKVKNVEINLVTYHMEYPIYVHYLEITYSNTIPEF
jgi:hypothetical protein|nr:MAG TPA: hypothetical protein [Caudoviricetes sp.]